MDVLLRKKRRPLREEPRVRIEVQLEPPSLQNFAEFDFEALCGELGVGRRGGREADEDALSDFSDHSEGRAEPFHGDRVAAALMLKGAGYEEDSFVDDSDLLPAAVVAVAKEVVRTPALGGFFVNVEAEIAEKRVKLPDTFASSDHPQKKQTTFRVDGPQAGENRPPAVHPAATLSNPVRVLAAGDAPKPKRKRRRDFCTCVPSGCQNKRCKCFRDGVACGPRCHQPKNSECANCDKEKKAAQVVNP
ncbi:hypothetical protein M3Y99_01656300 [Aphelenchoides fujianensis]|nr:hypothetical protein M3Y99_01656300 [Aphelenchoides fujianensis]